MNNLLVCPLELVYLLELVCPLDKVVVPERFAQQALEQVVAQVQLPDTAIIQLYIFQINSQTLISNQLTKLTGLSTGTGLST